ncbi:hypothetical protein CMQ_2357 [Grosmannia clavigera kw1407]|uniref:Uncharacterized protein n=1 Tax=Grosmannia clavigera (strain kw1407 / UAMH 11150) TaxID=655863 RepID=F0XIQ1_GROCL|nr:uncharacterized protein CMQ_2357 [Grosmannia clavigera kw1407]EFX02308.1 hypothetical protein CMQ_2357 [Grosmannia clavigera kw1407]
MSKASSHIRKSALAATLFSEETFPPTPMIGSLPSQQQKVPVVRGAVYCSIDFPWRAAEWFRQEWTRQGRWSAGDAPRTATISTVCLAKRLTTVTTPMVPAPRRIQPARAAKRRIKRKRVEEEEEKEEEGGAEVSTKPDVKKAKTTRWTVFETSDSDMDNGYLLIWTESGHEYGNDGNRAVELFRRRLVALLAEKQKMLRLRRGTTPSWNCPLAARPLGCTEMAYCMHGVRRGASDRGDILADDYMPVMEAQMDLCLSPVPWPVSEPKSSYDDAVKENTSHLDERTVEICGLRFAVDTCHGGLRVMMT